MFLGLQAIEVADFKPGVGPMDPCHDEMPANYFREEPSNSTLTSV